MRHLSLLFRAMLGALEEAAMLADASVANVRAALSGKPAITSPAKRAI